jgi:hypothetical protein
VKHDLNLVIDRDVVVVLTAPWHERDTRRAWWIAEAPRSSLRGASTTPTPISGARAAIAL